MTSPAFPTDAAGVALDGYDPVAYTERGTALRGSPDHARRWRDATWHFENEQHADLFARDPERYAPHFDGRCAFGASFGKQAAASPAVWRVIDGKVCLMRSRPVRLVSRLFTRRISAALADPDLSRPS